MPKPTAPLAQLQHDAIVELYDLDLNPIGVNTILYFCNYSAVGGNLVWRGLTYSAIPIECKGFEFNGRGQLPRPQLTVANTMGAITSLMLFYGDLVGSRITRHRTLAQYLDGGSTPDPNTLFDDDIYFIDRKVSEDKLRVVFELASSLDLEGFKLPRRIITADTCGWIAISGYRGQHCGYAGPPVADETDNPTNNPLLDKCGGRLKSCKMRFGQYGTLRYGGFPGVDNVNT